MKKWLLVIALLGLWQNWDRVKTFVAPLPPVVAGSGEIILYATTWCGYCAKTRELFQKNGIAYTEQDIEKSQAARQAYDRLGGRGVPVIDARGTVIHGYNPQAILEAAR